ncbi:uncharacterized protein LOC144074717 [Stigmatopora argus]
MALTHLHPWIAFLLVSVIISHAGGRPAGGRRAPAPQPASSTRTRTTRESRGAAEARRERCAELTASWQENSYGNPRDNSTAVRLVVRPLGAGISRGLVFPERPLFTFVRRVYRCCQDGLDCRSVKGLQGRFGRGSDVELLLTKEIFSLSIRRAELHLQLTNPQQIDVRPSLLSMAKSNLPTRFISKSHGTILELRVDLLFLFRGLQEVAGGPGGGHHLYALSSARGKSDLRDEAWGELELALALGCSRAGVAVRCESSGVGLVHTPFVALYYR